MALNVIEICAGAGGQSLGLERAGFDHLLAVELDPTAAQTLRLNRPNWDVRVGDVADKSVWDPQDYAPTDGKCVDLLAGGVPCPPFSIAGKQLGANDERDLFAWAVEQVGVIRPRAVLLENVRGLSQARFAAYRQHVLDRLSDFGYQASWKLLQASDFGVPQLRPRFVLVAMEPEFMNHFAWPEPTKRQVNVGEALLDLMASEGWAGADDWATRADGIGPTLVGGSKKHGGADLGPTRAKAAWAKLGVDGRGIANHAPGPDDPADISPRLTLAMAARIQGWNDQEYSWNFFGGKTSQYRQIGNAFPPPVAHAIGAAIVGALNKTSSPQEMPDVIANSDALVTALKTSDGFIESERLRRASGLTSRHESEFDRRMAEIRNAYEIESKTSGGKTYYRIGRFKGFVGQGDHSRNSFLRMHRSRVS